MGRRRRRVIRIVKKKLPTVFVCPRCGEEAVRVTIAKDTGHATVLCALCNLKDDFPAHPAAQAIDVYSYFTDRFYGVKDARAIIPRERETFSAPTEEADVEEQLAPPETLKREVPTETPQSSMPVNEPMPEAQLGGTEQSQSLVQESAPKVEAPMEAVDAQSAEAEKEKEDDSEPFADILDTPKDKKRYSSNPLPQQPPEQTS
ncbi:MAG TPA: transcription elongation factor 1 family protein [Dongiaceae bacterium]|nr:transcription elongation factor 1 family protein [Dongiaceae bacterium]